MKKLITIIAAAGLVLTGAVAANATPEDSVTVWWLVPEDARYGPSDDPRGDGQRVDESGFPQVQIPAGLIPCGRTAQVDRYTVADAERITADGVLRDGEDHDAVLEWRFVDAVCDGLADTGSPWWVPGVGLFVAGALCGLAAWLLAAARKRRSEYWPPYERLQ